jgi:acyl carrier protein
VCTRGTQSRYRIAGGDISGFDSMPLISMVTAGEERLGIEVDTDEIDDSIFKNIGTLVDFVKSKTEA